MSRHPADHMMLRKPHIVLVVADDLGFNGVGFRNAELRTPNIDGCALHTRALHAVSCAHVRRGARRLADEGTVLEDFEDGGWMPSGWVSVGGGGSISGTASAITVVPGGIYVRF